MRRNKTKTRGRAGKTQNRRVGGHTKRRQNIRLQTIGDIAAVLGHETRNLFGALKTCLHVLRRNSHLADEDRELLDIIETGARRLGEVMNDFAVFSRSATPRYSAFEPHALIDEIAASLQQRRSLIVLEKQFDARITEIQADRDQLRQALWHLLCNGAQAAGDGGTVSIQTAKTKSGMRIVIHDSGPGIAETELAKIFEPLYTTKPRSVGLGLPVARRLIEAQGGRLSVQPGNGAFFSVELPTAGQARGRHMKSMRERKR